MQISDAIIKPVPGLPGYFVGSDGVVWSAMKRGGGRYTSLHPLRVHRSNNGYLRATMRANGVQRHYTVHGLVALTFLGPRPDGMVVCHRNLDQLDNRSENLMYATQAANIQQGVDAGRHVRGERQHLAKLTEDDVRAIHARVQSGESLSAIAHDYPVGIGSISNIKTGRTWRHLTAVSATA